MTREPDARPAGVTGLRQAAVLLSVLLAFTLLGPTGSARGAEGAEPSGLRVSSTPARAGASSQVEITLVDSGGAGVPGAAVRVERWNGSSWSPVASPVTDDTGRASWAVLLDRAQARNRLRVVFAGDDRLVASSAVHDLVLVRTPTVVGLSAPAKVVDEKRGTVTVRWRTVDGQPVAGAVVLQKQAKRRTGWTGWSDFRRLTTGADGTARTGVRPRWTTRWRVVAAPLPWAEGARSVHRRTVNVPPGKPVVMPKGAPRPRVKLAPQRRAVGAGANVTVSRIPAKVWRSMKGRSWRPGCPVGRNDLRLVRTNYWGFDGYRRRGELVVAASARSHFEGALEALYAAKVPIRSMRRVDHFGTSKKLRGADDYRSMAADNTSVFNCRRVVGNPAARSPHSYGRSFDINPWENPYRSRQGLVPNRWWATRSHSRVAWRSHDHKVVRIMRANGFSWTYGHGDLHHFDAVGRLRGAERGLAELLASEACTTEVCH